MNRQIASSILRRLRRSVVIVPALAILIVGCSTTPKGVAATPPSGKKTAGASYVSSAPLSGRLTTATITDPSLNNMVAGNVTIPAGWKLEGIVMMSPCAPAPGAVFRAYSPDGLMQIRSEPILGWRWNANTNSSQTSCANISGVISAADFLKYYIGTIEGGVHVVGTMPVTPVFAQWTQHFAAQANENNSRLPKFLQANNTGDSAALRVEVVNGSFVVEERLRAGTVCAVRSNPGPSNGGSCFARLDILTAPKGRLDTLVQLADSNKLPNWAPTPEWKQATFQQLSERNAREGAARLAAGRAEAKAFHDMMYNAFQQNMARSESEHAAFMQQQEASFRSSMNNANAAMNARSTAASDWVDYALDQQTVTGAGGTVKVSNAYSQTWSNGQGQWYQSNDPNANPNGVLQGNWTQTTQVHGNGQPQ